MTKLLLNEITVQNSTYKTKVLIFLIFLDSVTNFDFFSHPLSLRHQQLILRYNF